MSYCGECYYSGKKLKPCMNCYEGSEAKTEYTNADRIRSMTDEELAELFTKLAWNSEVQTTPLKYLEWLQSEVEGE